MKKLLVLLSSLITLLSCSTSEQQDTQMLQSKYEKVYKVNGWDYVVCDSSHVYHITVTRNGEINTTIKIK